MAKRLERESCDCKTCVWSMGPGCWSVESYLLTPPLNQVKNASSSFLFAFFCILPFLKDPWILEILTLTAQGRALLWNSPPHSLPTDLWRWRFCTPAVMFKDEKILKRVVVVVYCLKALSTRLKLLVAALLLSQLWVAEYIILTIFCGFSSNWILHYFPLFVCPSVRHRRDI